MQVKRILIIGNGFDLDFGSDTRYSTFAKTFFSKPSETNSELFRFLKGKYDTISDKHWFDFEKEIEDYVKSIKGIPSQDTVDADRKEFLQLQGIGPSMDKMGWKTHKEEKSDYVDVNIGKNPYLFRNPIQMWGRKMSVANEMLNLIASHPTFFSGIITFNYTNLVEYLKVAIDEYVDHDDKRAQEVLNAINVTPVHIEPRADGSKAAVLGVDDSVDVHQGYGFLKKGNQMDRHRRESIIQDIYNADEIVVFGHSLGDSDASYFKPLFKDMFSSNPSHGRKLTFITCGSNQRLWRQIEKFSGVNNVMPQIACTDIHFIDTSVVESMLEYKSFLNSF